jgi:drug/metabolite transporter (DMT)-like permease
MSPNDNAIVLPRVTFSSVDGPLFASLGVLCFSLSFTATRAALGSFGAVTVGAGRAVIAAVFAALWLYASRATPPTRAQWWALVKVSAGVVVGFPVLSAVAMREVSATHGAVVFSVTPALTAVFAALLGGERPSRRFWAASSVATACAVLVGLSRSHGALSRGDALLLVAVVLVALGYAEGGRLARCLAPR